VLRNVDTARYKRFNRGLAQLREEGAIQILFAEESQQREPIMAAVGVLQFDVVTARLRTEYGVDVAVERLPYACARWLDGDTVALAEVPWPRGSLIARDAADQRVILFATMWHPKYLAEKYPEVQLRHLG
jgi:peptide chain release factor 3